jgi:hypothetical protein
MPLGVEPLAVESGYAAGFLTPMLQGMQAKRNDACRAGYPEDAEHAALKARAVIIRVAIGRGRGADRGPPGVGQ